MARPATNHEYKKTLLAEAALKVFAKYGYAGTTTQLLAKEVRNLTGEKISPPLIYHYYENKEALFVASLKQLPPLQKFSKLLHENGDQPLEGFLPVVARTYTEFLKAPETLALLRIVFIESPTQPQLPKTILSDFIPKLMLPMLQYFQGQVEKGAIRPMKFDQLLLQLIGPMIMRRIALSVLPVEMLPVEISTDEEFIESLVQTLMKGIRAEG